MPKLVQGAGRQHPMPPFGLLHAPGVVVSRRVLLTLEGHRAHVLRLQPHPTQPVACASVGRGPQVGQQGASDGPVAELGGLPVRDEAAEAA